MTSTTEHSGRRPRVDWAVAKAWYLGLPPQGRSFRAVADRFGVSDARVSQVARRDGWLDAADEIARRVERRLLSAVVRNMAERAQASLELNDRLVAYALGRLPVDANGDLDVAKAEAAGLTLELALKQIPSIFKTAQLAAGNATENLAVADVQPVLIALAQIAVRRASAEHRDAVLEEIRGVSAGLFQLEPAAA